MERIKASDSDWIFEKWNFYPSIWSFWSGDCIIDFSDDAGEKICIYPNLTHGYNPNTNSFYDGESWKSLDQCTTKEWCVVLESIVILKELGLYGKS